MRSILVSIALAACVSEVTSNTTDDSSTGNSSTDTGTETGTETGTDTQACDMLAQDCAPGQKCVAITLELLGDWVATTCAEASTEGSAPGSLCFNGPEGFDTCGPESMCLQLGTGEGLCFPFCDPSSSCAALDGMALNCERLDAEQSEPLALGVHLCQLDCQPLLGDCPAALFGCYPGDDRFSCRLTHPGAGLDGEPCESHLDCASGTACASGLAGCAGAACCTSYCALGDVDACAGSALGSTCVSPFEPEMAPAGLEAVGWCL